MTETVPQITPAGLRQLLAAGEPIQLLDVREPFEWRISNLGRYGAKLIRMGDLPARIEELDRNEPIVVYCRTGSRSDLVAKYLVLDGFERVWSLNGGINAWARTEDPDLRQY